MAPVPRNPARVAIERVVAGGDGLAHQAGGRVVFVPGALPDELVDIEVVAARRDYARGELRGVVEPSPHRTMPPCPELARGCGGCDWQHIDAPGQLAFKADIVRDALRRTAKMPDATVTIGPAVPPWAYRTSMRFALDHLHRPALRMARRHDVVDVERCMIAHPLLVDLVRNIRLPAAEEVSLRVSASTGQRTAWWTPRCVVARDLPSDVTVGEQAFLVERVGPTALRVSAGSFFQSGPQAAEVLVGEVRRMGGDELSGAAQVVDLYGGVGLFAACAVPPLATTVLVEGSPSACADARHNLAGRDATVVESQVEEWQPCRADVVIADPSRRGLGPAAVARIVGTRAPVVVLVSCDPVAFARDALLLSSDYRLTGTVVVDLFPQTHHVEVISRFEAVRG